MWHHRERFGVMPLAGGWLEQPLPILVQIDMIDLIYRTMRYKNSKGYNMRKLTATQRELIFFYERES